MKKPIVWAQSLFLILFFISASAADDVSFPKIKGWKLEVSSTVYTPGNLWDLINGAAESYLSYDFVDLHLGEYINKAGTLIHAEIYRHSSTENAFGIYSSERSPEYNFLPVGIQGYLEEGVLNYFTGQFYIKLYSTGSGEEVQESLKLIARSISDHMGQMNKWPGLLEKFPEEGRLENHNHYTRENFIGFNFLHSAFTAEYEAGYKLFVIQGKDKAEILEMVQAYLKFTKQDIDPEEESSFTIKDRYNGEIPVVLFGNYMAGAINGADSDEAMKKLENLVENLKE
ncbi:DUF6599 family protein [Bacteroidota bacterium]